MDDAGFEATLDRLERVVDDLESGDLGLEAALGKYQEGVGLLARGYGLLDRAEQRVALLAGGAEGDGLTADGVTGRAS